jgi:hypothetical protein
MAESLRFIPQQAKKWLDDRGRPIAVAEVTTRTIQGRFLLKPTLKNRFRFLFLFFGTQILMVLGPQKKLMASNRRKPLLLIGE